ncbi:MAG: TRAP transporter substrate-binding protein [Burkholderiaceae bacterium]
MGNVLNLLRGFAQLMRHISYRAQWFRHVIATSLIAMASLGASAQVKLDISVPERPNELHALDAARFAERVARETNGAVLMTTHPNGTLGVKQNESLVAIGEGVVPMGNFVLFLNASRSSVMAIESLPFLAGDEVQLKLLHKHFRPIWEAILAKNNQKALYLVPWPNHFFFVKKPLTGMDDLKGLKMRAQNQLTTDWISRLGMTPVPMGSYRETLPALGSGMLDGVATSAVNAVALKYWDFMKYGYVTNHIWASNVMSINLDAWKKLTPAQQATIERIGKEMEPQFWEASKQDNEKWVAQLRANGMTIAPAPKGMIDEMAKRTSPLWEIYAKPTGDEVSLAALSAYRKEVGK